MSEEIDKHVLRKYEIITKLGKGVALVSARLFLPHRPLPVGIFGTARVPRVCGARLVLQRMLGMAPILCCAGVRHRVEVDGQEDARNRCSEKDLRRVPKRDRCAAHLSRDHVSAGVIS